MLGVQTIAQMMLARLDVRKILLSHPSYGSVHVELRQYKSMDQVSI